MRSDNFGNRFDGYYSRACADVDRMVIDNLVSERANRTGLKIKKEESTTVEAVGLIGLGLFALASMVVISKS